jgi:hypothetical protein
MKGDCLMKKKQEAAKLSDKKVEFPQDNIKLIDQTHFKIDQNGKVIFSKKPFDQTDKSDIN